ncbi:MAG TPA: class I SAM-dependent methyltransferase [Polyangiaceae bacterium]|nr:class I SAM-dependent methyltransferase [Polyangiaceae bacterium]
MTAATPTSARSSSDGSGALRSLLNELETSAGALAALAAAFHARAAGLPLAPSVGAAVDGVLATLGVQEAIARLPLGELRSLLAEIRVFEGSHRRLVGSEPAEPGWAPPSRELLQAAGEVSAGLPRVIRHVIAPRLPGLAESLDTPGARFLDVGTGVGALAIEMARAWPELAVVGIEPWAPAFELALSNVQAARLEGRVELRPLRGEDLADEGRYDLGWIPSLFIAEAALPSVIACVRRALRSGAWLLMPVLRADPSSLAGSVVRLRSALWGGTAITTGDAAARLAEAGFVDLQSFSSSPNGTTGLLAARPAPVVRGLRIP